MNYCSNPKFTTHYYLILIFSFSFFFSLKTCESNTLLSFVVFRFRVVYSIEKKLATKEKSIVPLDGNKKG